jgi:hypothetical protein
VPYLRLVVAGGAGVLAYWLVVTGKLTIDVGIGRRTRPLGPLTMEVAARPETLFDVIAGPYLERTPKALSSEIEVLQGRSGPDSSSLSTSRRPPIRRSYSPPGIRKPRHRCGRCSAYPLGTTSRVT